MKVFAIITLLAGALELCFGNPRFFLRPQEEKEQEKEELGTLLHNLGGIIVWGALLWGLLLILIVVKTLWYLA